MSKDLIAICLLGMSEGLTCVGIRVKLCDHIVNEFLGWLLQKVSLVGVQLSPFSHRKNARVRQVGDISSQHSAA